MKDDSENSDFSPAKILLVDDDADMRDYGSLLLEQYGYAVSTAGDGQAALNILAGTKPDLIVSDVMMPRMDGLEFLKIVRETPATREIPVILLSARDGEQSRVEGLDAGADDYIEKPFSANELLARVKAHLKMARIRGESAEREYQLRIEAERAAEALRESEERLRLVIESVEDYAIITTDLEGTITGWNTGAEKSFGWMRAEAVGQSVEMIFTPEDRENSVHKLEMQTALENGRADDERWHYHKDETRFFVSGVLTLLKDGASGFVKIARDQTEKMRAEKAVRDREIMQRIVGAQELERKRLARDLHDELGQQFTALRLNLERAKQMCDDEAVCAVIDKIQTVAKRIDDGVDFIAWELRPAVLDDLGLYAALDKYVREWSRHTGITAELLGSEMKNARLLPETETNLYRITQEALNNISKHACASSVEISIRRRDDLTVLIIADDGIGFDLVKINLNRNDQIKLSLIGMKERASLVGGSFEIESAPDSGTTVFVRVPFVLQKNGI